MATVHSVETNLLPSLNQIHALNTQNPVYRSTKLTMPHGFSRSQFSWVVLVPSAVDVDRAQAITENIITLPQIVRTVIALPALSCRWFLLFGHPSGVPEELPAFASGSDVMFELL